jgi:hypothetical protein
MQKVLEHDPVLAGLAVNGRSFHSEGGEPNAPLSPSQRTRDRQPLDDRGVSLPEELRLELRKLRITAWRAVSLASQKNGPVVRGTESGGAVEQIGHYVTFAAEDGSALEWLHPQDAIAPNQTHAVVVAPCFLRVEVFRLQRNYEVAVTKHASKMTDGKPKLMSTMMFRGRGFLGLEIWGREKAFRGAVLPTFYTRGGEQASIPDSFQAAVKAAVAGACCIGCRESHFLRAQGSGTVGGL